jgi:hypothetical protein
MTGDRWWLDPVSRRADRATLLGWRIHLTVELLRLTRLDARLD